jgi:ribosome-associated translation inhibitor RaiA
MQIQVNTGHNIDGGAGLVAYVSNVVESALNLVSDHITRVEVHLSDETSSKSSPNNIRCVMEARLEHHQPVAATDHASTVDEAVTGAADKLTRLIDHTLGRLQEQAHRRVDPAPDALRPE